MMIGRLRSFYSLLLLPALACASPGSAITAFSDAAACVSVEALRGYNLINDSTVDRKIYEVAADPDGIPTRETFEGVLDGNERLAIRMRGFTYLRDYAQALGALAAPRGSEAAKDAGTELQRALAGLVQTCEAASGAKSPVSAEELSVISGAVAALTSLVIENERRRALQRIVTGTDPALQRLCAILRDELPGYAGFVESNLATVETEMIIQYKKRIATPSFSLESRVAYLQKIRNLHRDRLDAGPFLRSLGDAADKLGRAHTALRRVLDKPTGESGAFMRTVRELSAVTRGLFLFSRGGNDG